MGASRTAFCESIAAQWSRAVDKIIQLGDKELQSRGKRILALRDTTYMNFKKFEEVQGKGKFLSIHTIVNE